MSGQDGQDLALCEEDVYMFSSLLGHEVSCRVGCTVGQIHYITCGYCQLCMVRVVRGKWRMGRRARVTVRLHV